MRFCDSVPALSFNIRHVLASYRCSQRCISEQSVKRFSFPTFFYLPFCRITVISRTPVAYYFIHVSKEKRESGQENRCNMRTIIFALRHGLKGFIINLDAKTIPCVRTYGDIYKLYISPFAYSPQFRLRDSFASVLGI